MASEVRATTNAALTYSRAPAQCARTAIARPDALPLSLMICDAAQGGDRQAAARAFLLTVGKAVARLAQTVCAITDTEDARILREQLPRCAQEPTEEARLAAFADALIAWTERTVPPGMDTKEELDRLLRMNKEEDRLINDKALDAAFPRELEVVADRPRITGSHGVTIDFVRSNGRDFVLKTVPAICTHMALREAAAYNFLRRRAVGHELHAPLYHGMRMCNGGFELLLERADTCSADVFLASQPELCMSERVTMALQIAEAVLFINQRGILHRDIALRNAVRVRNRWVLIDFGLALVPGLVSTEGPSERENVRSGALPERAPESIDCGEFNRRTEVYMLGCALLHIFSGARNTGKGEVSAEAIEAVHKCCPVYGQIFAPLVADCVNPMPGKRPDLRQVVEELADVEKHIREYERMIAKRRRR